MEASRWATYAPAEPSQGPPATPPAEEPAAPKTEPSYDPSMDEFAQTRPPDDLFDDDFTPLEYSEPIPEPAPSIPGPTFPREPPRGPRNPGGRGRCRGVHNQHNHGQSHAAPHSSAPTSTQPPAATQPTTAETIPQVESSAEPLTETHTLTPTAPAPAADIVPTKPTAVRGDRSATGGPKKIKLTESELNEKLAAMSLKNKELQLAHERSQKDQEVFEAREAVAAQRRKEEKVNRTQMMGEREKNRQRKLQVMGGREWDMEKNEEDFRDEGRNSRRGAHGGVTGVAAPSLATSRYATVSPARDGEEAGQGFHGSERGGRGDRGRGRGRGRGTGGRRGRENTPTPDRPERIQFPPKSSDFPELPANTAPKPIEPQPKPPTHLSFPKKNTEKNPQADPRPAPQPPKETNQPPQAKTDTPSPTPEPSYPPSPPEKKSWADQVTEGVTSPT